MCGLGRCTCWSVSCCGAESWSSACCRAVFGSLARKQAPMKESCRELLQLRPRYGGEIWIRTTYRTTNWQRAGLDPEASSGYCVKRRNYSLQYRDEQTQCRLAPASTNWQNSGAVPPPGTATQHWESSPSFWIYRRKLQNSVGISV